RTKPRHWANRVNVCLACVTRVSFGKPKHVTSSRSQKAVPKPQGHTQFGVVPGVATPVVMPNMPGRRVRVYEITEMPKAIPTTRVNLLLVERKHCIQSFLNVLFERRRAI